MSDPAIDAALTRLRMAADTSRRGWVPTHWTRVDGEEPRRIDFEQTHVNHPYGAFVNLGMTPGSEIRLGLDLDLPGSISGVSLVGDRLEMLTMSIFRASFHRDGVSVLDDEVPSVALGPALVTVVPEIAAGGNGQLVAVIRTADHQLFEPFNWIHFTTPRLRARYEALDLGWAQLFLAQAVAGPEDEAALEAAAALVPVDLETADSHALELALGEMAGALASLHERVRALRVHISGHSHIDMNWLWTWPDTVEVIRRDFRSIVAMMHDYPEMHFTHSQPATYRVIEELEPDLFAEVQGFIAAGRWEAATMQWVEGDSNMASGEATARQVTEGVGYSRERLGVSPSVFMAPDTFGLSANLPQVALSAGTRFIYHCRCNPGLLARGANWPAYWWEGIDGTRILAITSLAGYSPHISAAEVARAAVDAQSNGIPAGLLLHGVGDHGGGPTRHGLDLLGRLQEAAGMPTMLASSIAGYGQELLDAGCELPHHRGETDTTFEGCYTTHADTKLYNRLGENLLQTAETLAVLAGTEAPEALNEAWRTVLFNQFHDILDGSAIHESYVKHAEDFAAVRDVASEVIDDALRTLGERHPQGSITVTNPLGWDRTEVVVLPGAAVVGDWLVGPDGDRVPVQRSDDKAVFLATVPAFATAAFDAAAAPSTGALPRIEVAPLGGSDLQNCAYIRVETEAYQAVVEKQSGIIVGFHDLRTGHQLAASSFGWRDSAWSRPELGLNVMYLQDEMPHEMSAWNMERVLSEHVCLSGATTRVLEAGPVRAVLEVRRDIRASTMVQRIIFYAGTPRIDFETELDWREAGSAQVGVPDLKVAFNGQGVGAEAWYEVPFGAVRRDAGGREVPALRWAAMSNSDSGFAVLNDCKHGHDALGSRLRLTLVRSAYSPDSIADIGHHHFRYAFMPHQGDWRQAQVPRRAAEFNQPLLVVTRADRSGDAVRGGLQPSLSGAPGILLAGMKTARAGNGGRVLRLYDSTGEGGEVTLAGLPVDSVTSRTNVLEDPGEVLVNAGGEVRISLRPWEVVTILVR